MTTGPRLRLGRSLVPGVLAVALFGMMALVVLNTEFSSSMAGYPDGITVTKEIGYAMLDLTALQSTDGGMAATEPFLVSFLLVAIVLDAALDASLVLAKREEDGEPVTALSSVPFDQSRETGPAGDVGAGAAATDGGATEAASTDGRATGAASTANGADGSPTTDGGADGADSSDSETTGPTTANGSDGGEDA